MASGILSCRKALASSNCSRSSTRVDVRFTAEMSVGLRQFNSTWQTRLFFACPCYICTQALHWKTKEGLVRGCSCRGTAGFAHVSCLAEQAKILVAEADENHLRGGALPSRRRHARRPPRSRDDARGHGTDCAARARWRAPNHNGRWILLARRASRARRPRDAPSASK